MTVGHEESRLKSELMLSIKMRLPHFLALRHEDVRTRGIPDMTVTGNGRTTWFEIKHGTPLFESEGYQELTCRRLASKGFCRYVVYRENAAGADKVTMIVHPDQVARGQWQMEAEVTVQGYNHTFVADYIHDTHNGSWHA